MTVQKGQTWVRHGHTYPEAAVEVLNVDDGSATVEFTPEGGGFVYCCPVESFITLHTQRPADAGDPPWLAAQFTLDLDAGPWPGYWQGFRWNGWATPAFERDTLVAILDAVEAEWVLLDDDVFVVTEEGVDPMHLEPRAVTLDGAVKQLYAFDGWTFSVATPQPEE